MAGKTELVEKVAQGTGLSQADVGKVLDEALAEIRRTVDSKPGKGATLWLTLPNCVGE